jgi:DNA-binding transcriptional LysR family regulator
MRRSDLADLTAFVAVAENLSFRAAAARLEVTPSALSHTIRQLEERLGVRLLHRTTRSVSLTDAGLRLLTRLQPAMGQISGALEDLNEERNRPFGRLRIHARSIAAQMVMAPVWGRFVSAYPEVHLELRVDDTPLDIVAEGFDAGIGLKDHAAADMIAVRATGPMRAALVGAPSYFAQRPQPRMPGDLKRHSCVQLRTGDGEIFKWPFERGGKRRQISVDGPVTVNSPAMAVRAAVDGLGIAYTVEAMVDPFLRSGQLVRVLENWSPSFAGWFLYYPSRRQVPAALRALIDTIRMVHGPGTSGRGRENPFATEIAAD